MDFPLSHTFSGEGTSGTFPFCLLRWAQSPKLEARQLGKPNSESIKLMRQPPSQDTNLKSIQTTHTRDQGPQIYMNTWDLPCLCPCSGQKLNQNLTTADDLIWCGYLSHGRNIRLEITATRTLGEMKSKYLPHFKHFRRKIKYFGSKKSQWNLFFAQINRFFWQFWLT